ncbi:hypothetical protein OESDEN_13448 [Oesophagostomum dentatum]|uniref:rRNA biogenesis protein RRP36 n=1 Tax=Oesophagostomum dentatum TaxID=61180 RepID=A0A0B1STD6_OESDE|nr:hypothetical protein OESDEN_13448 [Oesophagostomum dentatum]
MSEEAPRRTFPKKAGSFSSKKDMYKKKALEGSIGGSAPRRKAKHHSKLANSSAVDAILSNKNKRKVADGMKVLKNGKPPKVDVKRKKKVKRNEPVKGTSIDHKMLGGSEDEMYTSEDEAMDVTDMLEDEVEEAMVPITNSKNIRSLNGKRSSPKKANLPQEEEEEEIVEFSTGRGSSRLQFSDDSDEERQAVPNKTKKKLSKRSIYHKNTEEEPDDEEEVEWPTSRGRPKIQSSDVSEQKPGTSNEGGNFGDDDDSESESEHATERNNGNARERKCKTAENEIMSDVLGDKLDDELEDEEEAAVADKLGLKLFNKAYFGTAEKDKKTSEAKKKIKEAKKEEYRGQHRPKEISSKKPVSTFRPVYDTNIGKKKRDPRFDNRTGQFKERCFDDNYRFLEDLRKQEREELSKEATECDERGDAETAEKIREVIRRMDNREKTKAERKMKEETLRELRQENIDRMMRGERPVFRTKAQVKMMNLEKKFKQLKKDNKLDKYMKRKAKKEAHKEAKKKPAFEQMYGYQ